MVCSTLKRGRPSRELFKTPSLEHVNRLRDDIRRSWSPEERASRACRGHSRRQAMLLSILAFGDCRAI